MDRQHAWLLGLALAAASAGALAQDFVFSWSPRTGDVWVDDRLADINQYGERYRDPFIDEMTRYYGAPRDLVSDLLLQRRWAPGDIYYACALAQLVGQPCRNVVDEWDRDHAQGWGAIAQRMGIKPGSAEFHRLKAGFIPTYDRWGRPIVVDDDLQADFPGRGRGPHGTALVDHDSPGHGKPKAAMQGHGHGQPQGAGKGRGKPGQGHGRDLGKGNGGRDRANGGHGKGGHGRGKD